MSAEAIVVDDVGEGGGGVCILLEEGQAGTEMGKDDKMVRFKKSTHLSFSFTYAHVLFKYAISLDKFEE